MTKKTPTIPRKNSILNDAKSDFVRSIARAISRKYRVKITLGTKGQSFSHPDPIQNGLCSFSLHSYKVDDQIKWELHIFFTTREMTINLPIDSSQETPRDVKNRIYKFIDYSVFGLRKEPAPKKKKLIIDLKPLVKKTHEKNPRNEKHFKDSKRFQYKSMYTKTKY